MLCPLFPPYRIFLIPTIIYVLVLIVRFLCPESNKSIPDVVQLPRNVYPEAYDIHLEFNIQQRRAYGKEVISLNCSSNTELLYIHFSKLEIISLKVFNIVNGKEYIINAVDVKKDKKNELIRIQNKEKFKRFGKYSVDIIFEKTGIEKFTDDNKVFGFYVFNDTHSPVGLSAITHFDPAFARTLFPCLDDPFFRSKFRFDVTHTKDLVALSAMSAKFVIKINDSFTRTVFEESVPLPTYLTSIGLVPNIHDEFQIDDLQISVWRDLTVFNEIKKPAVFAVKRLREVFKLPPPIKHIDILICPMLKYAMENFGLITMGTELITMSKQYKELFAALGTFQALINHWWGNIVTHEWWSDLWMNEGLNEYLTYTFIEAYYENNEFSIVVKKGIFLGYINELKRSVFSPKLTYDVNNGTSSYIKENGFRKDVINKGKLLPMYLKYVIGENFVSCWRQFIAKNYFTSRNTWQFIDFMSYCSSDVDHRKEINQSLYDWLLTPGFPVLTVKKINNKKLQISQRGFFNSSEELITKLSISQPDGTELKDIWLTKQQQTVDFNLKKGYSLNFDRKTLASVWYEEDSNWIVLINQLSRKVPVDSNSLIYLGLLCDLNYAIGGSYAPVYAVFNVIEKMDDTMDGFIPYYRIYKILLDRLSTFTYSEDSNVDLAIKALSKFESLRIFKNCNKNIKSYSEKEMCEITRYFCTESDFTMCQKKTQLSTFGDPNFRKFIEHRNISDEATLYVKESYPLFKNLKLFLSETIESIINECLKYSVCRYKFIHTYSLMFPIISRKIAIAQVQTYFELDAVIRRETNGKENYERKVYVDPNFIANGFQKLSHFLS